MKFSKSTILFALSIIFSLNTTFSQNSKKSPFELQTGKDAAIIGAGAVLGISALLVMNNIDSLSDEKISDISPENVNSFDRIAIGPFSEDKLGDALLYGSFLLPLTFLTYEETREDFGTLALMFGEVVLLNAAMNGLVKGLTTSSRPFVYYENSPLEEKYKLDARHSFYSGHTSMSASNSFFTAKVFSEYLTDNTAKTLIWTAAAIIPAVTGFSRINTHNHFPSDVIVGYIVGAAIGYLIPEIHKYEKDNNGVAAPQEFIHGPIWGFQLSL